VVRKPVSLLAGIAVLAVAVALPAVAAQPSTSPGGSSAVEKVDNGHGKPPWAGGWKRVGEGHPGWSQEKADRFKAKFGDCFPPGQCKDKSKGEDQ
jgi:opacity protein-like surface antigen